MNANTVAKSEVTKLRKLNKVFLKFRELQNMMPLPLAQTLVLVALNEGKSLVELMRMAGVSQSNMSRYLLELSDRTRDGDLGSGMGLVTRETDPMELRRNMYSLSPKGREFFDGLLREF